MVYRLARQGAPFRLAICGQNFRRRPEEFETARRQLADRIVHWGFASESRYRQLLWEANVTVSTAEHEFFGISMVEAIYCGVFPLLPDALSYPELIPKPLRQHCLYSDHDQLESKLGWALHNPARIRKLIPSLSQAVRRFDWSQLAPEYDRLLDLKPSSENNSEPESRRLLDGA